VTLIGGVGGVLIGLASALLYIRTVQQEQGMRDDVILPALQPRDIMPIVVTAFGIMRTIAALGTLRERINQ
jgi:hypothetical protein